jgi:hypothetical protein
VLLYVISVLFFGFLFFCFFFFFFFFFGNTIRDSWSHQLDWFAHKSCEILINAMIHENYNHTYCYRLLVFQSCGNKSITFKLPSSSLNLHWWHTISITHFILVAFFFFESLLRLHKYNQHVNIHVNNKFYV